MPAKTHPDQVPEKVDPVATLPPPPFCYQPGGLANGPMQIRCPTCHEMVMTHVQYVTGLFTWLNFMALCIDGTVFCIPCCFSCCPFCMKSFKNTEHYCPRCNTFIGVQKLI